MAEFRRWLDMDSREATCSIEGSFDSDDITDYYMDPIEYGFADLISFDHDFVGREALMERINDPDREFVSLLWETDDVVDVYRSLFDDGDSHKFFNLPPHRLANSAFDNVLIDGELVGISRRRSYQPDINSNASLAAVDTRHTDPGTEVTIEWGEENSPNPRTERHTATTISATVSTVPYTEDLRKTTVSAD
jgi:vanillate/3-O-methylgallate O-demethylase